MAALIGDLVPDVSRFHDLIVNPSSRQNQRQHQSPPQSQRSHSRSQAQDSPTRRSSSRPRASVSTPRSQRRDDIEITAADRHISPAAATRSPTHQRARKPAAAAAAAATTADSAAPAGGASSTFPSPPPSSSPPVASGTSPVDDAKGASMASQIGDVVSTARQSLRHAPSLMTSVGRHQQPSPPPSQSFHIPDSSSLASSPSSHVEPSSTQQTSQEGQQTVVHLRDLAHMQSLADAQMLGGSSSASLDPSTQIKYEISGMPIADIIEMVAALLTKITTTNDLQHDAMQRNVAHQQQANQSNDSSSHMSPLSHSVLAFHGKNVPAITILSYLTRIHKYCPTTYEVFLSLLVYFDRMTERVNEIVMRSEQSRSRAASHSHRPVSSGVTAEDATMHDSARDLDESDSDQADDDDDNDDEMVDRPAAARGRDESGHSSTESEDRLVANPATYLVVDSFNIHRLIISGVTCASKFFSDVFYTNSRYAKVGGLPLAELNHLEIQFLVLNDFRLAVPVEDLEAYATMLVEFYAREVMAHKSAPRA
ncbi:Cyclin PHO80-like protein [Metarhizium album ARSEF 1941]|uniref:Cyclin PHO80-like protein n=1 Tax=Metarhizium album (strain ARSEF 1941) TaxID=1081103 RepID=A0A0B2X2R6_METAS|nr:Cyclin PHO80-like protein [Metarhizium album ARSEF 1941]KHO00599.1 Cyclin PHO80-like protein [Metarhizium album ARSEF 1941]